MDRKVSLQLCPQENSPYTIPKLLGNMSWAKCLSQCLNTSKWNKDIRHHNKKEFTAPPAASQGPPGCRKVWDASHQSKTNPTAIPPSEKDQNTRGGGRQRDVKKKSNWSEALKYERGSTTAQAWELCFYLWAKKMRENPTRNKKVHLKHTHNLH